MSTAADRRPTRERLVAAAAERFRRQGYAATGIKAVLDGAQAPYGSLYHFFPGGKQELGVAVIRSEAAVYLELVEGHFGRPDDVVALVGEFFEGAALVLEGSGFADACPIATFAAEIAGTDEPMRAAAADAFASWTDALAARLVRDGLDAELAHDLAAQGFCLLEGAFLLGRVRRDGAVVRSAGRALAALVQAALHAQP